MKQSEVDRNGSKFIKTDGPSVASRRLTPVKVSFVELRTLLHFLRLVGTPLDRIEMDLGDSYKEISIQWTFTLTKLARKEIPL